MSDDNKNGTAPKRPPLSSFAKGFAGSLGGVAEAVCLQPMDVIKTRLQLDNQGKYKGIAHCGNVGTPLHGHSIHACSEPTAYTQPITQ